MSSLGQSYRLRRVGFRDGTDEELTLLHAIEAPIEAERRPDIVPQPLASYIPFARSLPSHFDDHAWLVETAAGEPVACAYCWSNSAGDVRVMECDVLVSKDHRRHGIGSRLLGEICDETVRDGRSLLKWSTFDTVPAGEKLALKVGGRAARVNRTSELVLADVDWAMVEAWARADRARAAGYTLEIVDGAYPEHLVGDAVIVHRIMATQPRDDLDVHDAVVDAAFVVEGDRALVEAGRSRWTVFVRHSGGVCVGGTDVWFEPWDERTVLQHNTGIDPAHRGRGLAKWAKALVLQRIRAECPHAERVQTGNAFSNAAMLAINDALGFKVIGVRTEWLADVTVVRRALRRG